VILTQKVYVCCFLFFTCITKDSGDVTVLKLARGPNISGAVQCFGMADGLLSRTSKLKGIGNEKK
jgi:hypothetical protein